MTEREIVEVLTKLSNVSHRVMEISLKGGATAPLPYMNVLFQACGALAMTVFHLEEAQRNKTGIVRPQ